MLTSHYGISAHTSNLYRAVMQCARVYGRGKCLTMPYTHPLLTDTGPRLSYAGWLRRVRPTR